MPISAKEESGARSTGPQSSDYIAVIPIKKRRFPIIRPPSPPPPSSPALPEDVCKKQDANSAPAVSNSSNLTEVAACPSALMKSEKSIVPPEKQDNVIKTSNTKQPGQMLKKLESVGKDGAGTSAVSGGSVNMAWKQRVDTSPTQDNLGKQRVEASRTQDNMRNFSLKLSLTDGQSSVLTTSGVKSGNDDSLVRANRSNWDLNTTMDNWEASISDAASVSTDSVYGTVPSNINNFDVKPPLASTDLVGGSISGRLNLEDRKLKVVDSLYSMPFREAHTHASSLQLGLPMSSFDLKKTQVSQCPAASTDSRPNVARVLSSPSNSSTGVPVIVKREPFDEPSNQKLAEVRSEELKTLSLNSKMVKPELIQKCGLEIAGSSSHVIPNVVESALLVKAEPGLVRSHLSLSTSEETANRLNEQSLKDTKLCKKGTEVLQMSKALASESTRSSDSLVGGYLDTHVFENQVMSQDAKKISSNPDSSSVRRVLEEQKVSSVENTYRIQEHNIGSVGHNKSELTGELPSTRDDEDCVSEGKIDIPAGMDHDSFDSECESDANVATTGKERREDNEYEDGELREQPINMGQEGPTCAMQIENVSNGENEHDKSESLTRPSVVSPPPTENQDGEMQLPVDMDVEEPNECSDIIPYEKIMKTAAEDAQLQEAPALETLGEFRMDSPTASRREVGPYALNNPLEGQEVEYVPGEAIDSSISSMANLAPAIYSNAEYTDHVIRYDNDGEDCSTLPEMEACLNSEIVGKDGSDVNRTRVINLSRAYNMSSPGKSRSPDRSLPVQFGRKRLPDVALEGEKPHLRGRDEVYGDDFNRFSRERNRDMYSRNPRSGYSRDRGRGHNNMCSADWEPDQDFGSGGIYNGPVEYRNSRYNKYGSDYRNYGSGPNNRFSGGIGRGGRKFFNEEESNFRDRRRPYNGRDPMVGGPRKFRDFPDDNMETYPCSRPPPYEESDGGFSIRGERNFNNKGLRRIHSKSPIRLRSRSPGQWSSPRRRSPDGFVEQSHRRSPAMYRRGERVRSPPPGRACFQGDSMIRRQQGSPPPYMSRQMDDLREMNSGRDHHHGFGRGMMHHSRGGSSGRGSHRTRRYEMENSRERTRGDYFRFPMRGGGGGGRYHDFSGEGGNNDERRRLVDKRGPARHFRPSYSGGEEKNFVYSNNTDESSRSSYRMCQEEDAVYPERSNSRERQQQLERHTKNEAAAAAEDAAAAHNSNSKTRRVEEEQEQVQVQEQEENFRHSDDGEPNEELDDMQQSGKRKRF